MRKSVSLILITAMVLTMVIGMAGTAFADTAWTTRKAGATRVETAVEIAKAVDASDTVSDDEVAVVLARSDMYPDALAGAALAQQLTCPLLLTSSTSLDTATADAINAVCAAGSTAYILGGTSAISASVATAVGDLADITTVTRLSGADRYETAGKIADEVVAKGGVLDNVVVCTGENFPDALCASLYGQPIILTGSNSVPQKTMDWIQANRTAIGTGVVTFIGGTAAISDSVKNEMVNACPNAASIVRKAGADRYATCVEVLKDNGLTAAGDLAGVIAVNGMHAAFTTGSNFPDALAGGALGLPIILTDGALNSSVQTWLDTVCSGPDAERAAVYVLGGTAAVGTTVEEAIAKEVSCNGWVKPAVPVITSAVVGGTATGIGGVFKDGDVVEVTVATNYKLSTDASTGVACDTVNDVQVDVRALGPDNNTTYKSTWGVAENMILAVASADGTKATWTGTIAVADETVGPDVETTETFNCVAKSQYNQTSATVTSNSIQVYN